MKGKTGKTDIIVYDYGRNLYVNLTNRCSNACRFCLRTRRNGLNGHDLRLSREPSADEVIEALKRADLNSADEVVFCGYGEPTYRMNEMLRAAEFLKGRGASARLNTNGQGNLINGRDITGEAARYIDVVSVSLNNADAARYSAVCRSVYGAAAFGALLDFTRSCVPKFKRTVMTVVDSIGADEIEECRVLCESIGAEFRVRVADSYV